MWGQDHMSLFFQLFYLDYGTRATVQIEDLRHLRRKYAKLPAQGIQAR